MLFKLRNGINSLLVLWIKVMTMVLLIKHNFERSHKYPNQIIQSWARLKKEQNHLLNYV